MGGMSGARQTNLYVTTCKVCGYGIYKGQKWVWMCRTLIGMVHAKCVRRSLKRAWGLTGVRDA